MSMRELLMRWAKLEPERCWVERPGDDDPWCVIHSGFTHGWRVGSRAQDAMHIQAAVQEAITGHGWHWEVGYHSPDREPFYSGYIDTHDSDDDSHHHVYGDEPVYCLLSAYLQALEAN